MTKLSHKAGNNKWQQSISISRAEDRGENRNEEAPKINNKTKSCEKHVLPFTRIYTHAYMAHLQLNNIFKSSVNSRVVSLLLGASSFFMICSFAAGQEYRLTY